MLLAEDLALLLVDDITGKLVTDSTRLDNALAGAVLLELAMLGRVRPEPHDRGGRLVVMDGEPTGDELLEEALQLVADKQPVTATSVLGAVVKGLRAQVLSRLVDRGILRRDESKVLWVFPTTQWPAVDSAHEAQVRRRLEDVLVVGLAPDDRTRALVSLLSAVDAVHKVVPPTEEVSKRELHRRAKELAEGSWAGAAVRTAVEAVDAAVMATIFAATAISTTTTTSTM
jgi:hypothetical protein